MGFWSKSLLLEVRVSQSELADLANSNSMSQRLCIVADGEASTEFQRQVHTSVSYSSWPGTFGSNISIGSRRMRRHRRDWQGCKGSTFQDCEPICSGSSRLKASLTCATTGIQSSYTLRSGLRRTDLSLLRKWEPAALQEGRMYWDWVRRLLCSICSNLLPCRSFGPRRFDNVSSFSSELAF